MSSIDTSIEEGVLTVLINRPEKKNALTAEMYAGLADAFSEAQRSEKVRAVLLRGGGNDFTSGNDISLFVQSGDGPSVSPAAGFMVALSAMEKPVVACVRGYAVGVGGTMLIHCDHVIASDDVKIRFPFVDLGLCPEFGSTAMLRDIVGRRKAEEWLTLGRFISAEEALAAGFVNSVMNSANAEESAKEIASLYASKPSSALRATRKLMRPVYASKVREHMNVESEVFQSLRRSDEAQQIFKRFLEKAAVKG